MKTAEFSLKLRLTSKTGNENVQCFVLTGKTFSTFRGIPEFPMQKEALRSFGAV